VRTVDGRRGDGAARGCGGGLCKYSVGVEEEPEPEPGRGCRVTSVGVAYMEPAPVVAPGSFFCFHLSPQTVDYSYMCSSSLFVQQNRRNFAAVPVYYYRAWAPPRLPMCLYSCYVGRIAEFPFSLLKVSGLACALTVCNRHSQALRLNC
jgi:hypothetical protein